MRKSAVRADINVTPLVDIVLVLLIIFMVVAPMVARAVPVELPRTAHHQSKPDDGRDVPLSVTRTDEVFLRDRRVVVADLPRLVAAERQGASSATVYLQGDSLTSYKTVREVMEALRKAGISRVTLRTERLEPARAGR
jgi:biopolymer transport protein TolR